MLDECTEGIVLQQSNLVDSTVTLHLHLVVKRWNSLQVEQEAETTKKMLARFLRIAKALFHKVLCILYSLHACGVPT